jgi:hypothetical protein
MKRKTPELPRKPSGDQGDADGWPAQSGRPNAWIKGARWLA